MVILEVIRNIVCNFLAVNGKPVLPIGSSSSQDSSQDSSRRNTSQSDKGTGSHSDSDSEDGDVMPSDRSPRVSLCR